MVSYKLILALLKRESKMFPKMVLKQSSRIDGHEVTQKIGEEKRTKLSFIMDIQVNAIAICDNNTCVYELVQKNTLHK